jgi:hypothetical protein
MYGDTLFSLGIIVWYAYAGDNKYGWLAQVEFRDYGHCEPNSIRGKIITTSYGIPLSRAIDTIKTDAEKLGIKFAQFEEISPYLFYLNDGDSKDYPPPADWRTLLKKEAKRIGFSSYLD